MLDFRVEPLTEALIAEMLPIQTEYWKECAGPFLAFPADVDWNTYRKAQELGMLKVIVARDSSGRMAGAAVVIVGPDPHLACITASLPMLFLREESRGGYEGVRLIQTAEEEATRSGAQLMMTHGGIHNGVYRLFEHMKYGDWGRYFVKTLNGSSAIPVFKETLCHS